MNSVYSNPAYLKEMDDFLNEFKYLTYFTSEDGKREAYLQIVNSVKIITGHKQLKEAVTCGSDVNCSFCCHDTIQMGYAEAEYIKEIVREKNIIPNKHRIEQQNSNSKIKWMDKACPLLLDENDKGERLCSIYENRPLICRTHNSTMEPSLCNKENDPDRTIREAKIASLDALLFTAFQLGSKGVRITDPKKAFTTMHKILLEVI